MKSITRPGVWLMRRLSLLNKFLLVSFFMLLPLAYTAFLYLGETQKQARFMEMERDGVVYIKPLLHLLRQVQDHRGTTYLTAKGHEKMRQPRLQVQEKIHATLAEIAPIEKRLGAQYESTKHWQKINETLRQLLQRDVLNDAEGQFLAHTNLVGEIRSLMELVTRKSNLILDSDAASYHLMDFAVNQIPDLTERIAIARVTGTSLILRKELMTDDRIRLAVLEALAKDRYVSVTTDIEVGMVEMAKFRSGFGEYQTHIAQISKFLSNIDVLLSPGGVEVITAETFLESGSGALEGAYRMAENALPVLDKLLVERIGDYRQQEILTQGVALICLLVAIYLFVAFFYSVRSGIGFLKKALARLAAGDLTGNIEARANDEIGSVTDSLKDAQEQLRALTQDINRAAENVFLASNQIADGNEHLSQRTEAQASTLEETSASLEELTATVQRNAETVGSVNQVTQESTRVAEQGQQAMKRVAATMAEIEASSKKIGDIISLMDSVAFQTNILALNAAVEAARAGEQGRGFAVVAAEVRNLARSSADAAKQIKGLIAETREKVGAGVSTVDDTLKAIQESNQGILRVAQMMSEIAISSREQSDGIQQVNRAVLHMDDANQQNAAMVEEAGAATESLKNQASALVGAVNRFRVNGSKAGKLDPLAVRRSQAIAQPVQKQNQIETNNHEEWAEF